MATVVPITVVWVGVCLPRKNRLVEKCSAPCFRLWCFTPTCTNWRKHVDPTVVDCLFFVCDYFRGLTTLKKKNQESSDERGCIFNIYPKTLNNSLPFPLHPLLYPQLISPASPTYVSTLNPVCSSVNFLTPLHSRIYILTTRALIPQAHRNGRMVTTEVRQAKDLDSTAGYVESTSSPYWRSLSLLGMSSWCCGSSDTSS